MTNIKLITPVFAPKTWGNNDAIIKFLGKDPGLKGTIGEIFLASGLSDAEGGSTQIDGAPLRDIFADETKKADWFGERFKNTDEFPLLLKFLAVKEPLSLQVHPGDELLGNKRIPGKTEGWYAIEDSKVLCGFKKGFGENDFKALIASGFFAKEHIVAELAELCELIELKKGEALYVESGTVHAIIAGQLLEPQQPCNTTFRIYDWGRNDPSRQLHLDKALAALRYDSRPKKLKGKGVFLDRSNFKVEHLQIKGLLNKALAKEDFHLILPVKHPIGIDSGIVPGGQCALILANTPTISIKAAQPTSVFIISAKN